MKLLGMHGYPVQVKEQAGVLQNGSVEHLWLTAREVVEQVPPELGMIGS